METQLKLRILNVKDISHFVVREEETTDAQRYKALEIVLQKTYNCCDENKSKNFKIGSYVAVHIKPFSERSTKLWLRALIINIFNERSIMYGTYLVDFGLEKCSHKSSLRELKPHFFPNFVPFQAFDFYLSGIEPKKGVKTSQIIQRIKCLFDSKKNLVFAKIERKDSSLFGDISLGKDCDLASILIDEELVYEKLIESTNSRTINNNQDKHNSCSSYSHTCGANVRSDDLIAKKCNNSFSPNCKCNAIIQYRRKKLRDLLKELQSNGEEKLSRNEKQLIQVEAPPPAQSKFGIKSPFNNSF